MIIIGLFSIKEILGPVFFVVLTLGTIGGFFVSWIIKDKRQPYMDIFIGMLSLASLVVILGKLYETLLTFDNLLRLCSLALAWLAFFQSFGLKTEKSYALIQFISVCLLVTSVALALQDSTTYAVLLALFLFVLVFSMRLSLLCEKERKGSLIIGERSETMSLWQQVKLVAIIFSIVLIISSLVYPLVPRFESISFKKLPATLFSMLTDSTIMKLLEDAQNTLSNDKNNKETKDVDNEKIKTRETSGSEVVDNTSKKSCSQEEITNRFSASEYNDNINAYKIESLSISAAQDKIPLDAKTSLKAELKMNDGTIIPASNIVDWKVTGTAEVSIDKAVISPKKTGDVQISASYMGSFSNDISLKITDAVKIKQKKTFWFYLFLFLWWLVLSAAIAFIIWTYIKSRRLRKLADTDPKEFIKNTYEILCRGFKLYGIPKADYLAYREFFDTAKASLGDGNEPMHAMTEEFLEARFSQHKISKEHSYNTLSLFNKIRKAIIDQKIPKSFWKKVLFAMSVWELTLITG